MSLDAAHQLVRSNDIND